MCGPRGVFWRTVITAFRSTAGDTAAGALEGAIAAGFAAIAEVERRLSGRGEFDGADGAVGVTNKAGETGLSTLACFPLLCARGGFEDEDLEEEEGEEDSFWVND